MNRRRLCEQLCEECYTYFCKCKRKSFKHIHHYIMNEKIGEGSNSAVYKSLSLVNRKDVALKKIQLDKEEGVPITAIPDISIMRELKHPNIVSLTNGYMVDNILYLVFEFLPINLKHYMDTLHDTINFSRSSVFCQRLPSRPGPEFPTCLATRAHFQHLPTIISRIRSTS